jgi:hypothetical protein
MEKLAVKTEEYVPYTPEAPAESEPGTAPEPVPEPVSRDPQYEPHKPDRPSFRMLS